MRTNASSVNKVMPFAVEAAWVTSRWEALGKFARRFNGITTQDFNISIASVFESLRLQGTTIDQFKESVAGIRESIATTMNASATASLQAAHEQLLKCHVLSDLEFIVEANPKKEDDRRRIMELLDSRLEVIGANFSDKQYLLGIHRAAMELTR